MWGNNGGLLCAGVGVGGVLDFEEMSVNIMDQVEGG